MNASDVLQVPIADLPVSMRFYRQSVRMGFSTLEQVLEMGMSGLLVRPYFTYLWLSELIKLLKTYGLEERLK